MRKPRDPLAPVLAEYGVKRVSTTKMRHARQTHAGQFLARVQRQHGDAHLRDVLTTILESHGNEFALCSPIIAAVSDMLDAHRAWYERDAEAWLGVFDRLDLLAVWSFVKRNQRAVAPRPAIATILHAKLAQVFDPEAVSKVEMQFLDGQVRARLQKADMLTAMFEGGKLWHERDAAGYVVDTLAALPARLTNCPKERARIAKVVAALANEPITDGAAREAPDEALAVATA